MKRYFPTALALVITVLFLMLAFNGLDWTSDSFLTSLDMRWLDAKFRFRGELVPGNEVLIVGLDDLTLNTIGSARTFDRHHAARLIDQLAAAEPRVIGFDIFFQDPQLDNPENDRLFAEAIERAGNVVMAVSIDLESSVGERREVQELPPDFRQFVIEKGVFPATRNGQNQSGRLIQGQNLLDDLPIPILGAAASSFGFVNFSTDSEGFLRYQPQFIEWGGRLYPSLDLQLLKHYVGAPSVIINFQNDGAAIEQVEVGDYVIPTDQFGRFMLNFNGPNDTHNSVSWIDVEEGRVDPDLIRDKIVIIGPKAIGLGDAVPTSFDPLLAGVELHANVLDNILSDRFVTRNNETSAIDMILILAFGVLVAIYLPKMGATRSIFSVGVALVAFTGFNVWMFLEYGWILSYVYPGLTLVVSTGSLVSYKYIFEEREKKKTKDIFSHYLDQAVIDQVIEQPDQLKLGGEKHELTVLFSDIRGFSTFSEKMKPQELVGFLNTYFDRMTGLIFENLGTLDKLIGDAVMCFWGHPIQTKNHALRATIAALEMMEAVYEMQETVDLPGGHKFDIGIGVNTGDMVVGNMGSQQRFSYTVMGDDVNLGARLEGLNKFYGTNILITDTTYEAVKDRIFCRELDRVKVKGKDHAVTIFEPLGLLAPIVENRERERRGDPTFPKRLKAAYVLARRGERRKGIDRRLGSPSLIVDPKWEEIRAKFNHALELYRRADFDGAANAFDHVLTLRPGDGPSRMMKTRIEKVRVEFAGAAETFDPVHKFDEK